MGWLLESHRLGRLGGIEVRVAWSLYVVVGLFFLQYLPHGLFWALPLLALPFFVLAHEYGHAATARFFGVPVMDITLHALGGASRLGGRIPGAAAEFFIALAGPLVSFALAGACFLLAWLQSRAGLVSPAAPLAAKAVYMLLYLGAWQNLILGLFNLLPVFPLDGGRILLALVILWRGVEFGLRVVRPLARLGALAFIALGVYQLATHDSGGFFTALIGVMLLTQGGQEFQARQYAEQYANPGWGGPAAAPRNAVGGIFSLLDRLWVYRRESREEKENLNNQFSTRYSSVDFYGDHLRDATAPEKGWFARWWEKRRERREEARENQKTAERAELDARVDEVLAKVKREGIGSLTPGERALLFRASDEYRKDE